MAKVSIITGYYNRGDKLERTLDSLRLQDFDDFEIVVFDDASNDGTRTRLEGYAKAHPDASLVLRNHEENMGFVRGMIEAVADTKSPYIAIQGSGDTSHPDRIRHQAAVLDAEPDVVAVGCWYHSVTELSGKRQPRKLNADVSTLESLIANGPPFTHGEIMFRRSAYDAVGGYRTAFTFSQDYDLWLRLIRVGRFKTVPRFLYDRYTLRDGASYNPSKLALQGRYALIARFLANCHDEEVGPVLARLEVEGPEALVPLENPELQKHLFKTAIASVAWENVDASQQIVREYLTNPRQRQFATIVRLLCNNATGRFLLRQLASRR